MARLGFSNHLMPQLGFKPSVDLLQPGPFLRTLFRLSYHAPASFFCNMVSCYRPATSVANSYRSLSSSLVGQCSLFACSLKHLTLTIFNAQADLLETSFVMIVALSRWLNLIWFSWMQPATSDPQWLPQTWTCFKYFGYLPLASLHLINATLIIPKLNQSFLLQFEIKSDVTLPFSDF